MWKSVYWYAWLKKLSGGYEITCSECCITMRWNTLHSSAVLQSGEDCLCSICGWPVSPSQNTRDRAGQPVENVWIFFFFRAIWPPSENAYIFFFFPHCWGSCGPLGRPLAFGQFARMPVGAWLWMYISAYIDWQLTYNYYLIMHLICYLFPLDKFTVKLVFYCY